MSYWAVLAIGSVFGFFEASTLELTDPSAHCFLVDIQGDNLADLGVLYPDRIEFFEQALVRSPLVVTLPESSSAVDVVDLNGDGWCEVVTVAGGQVQAVSLLSQPPYVWEILFQAQSDYAQLETAPFLNVLALNHAAQRVIALPVDDHIELRALDGEVRSQFALGAAGGASITFGRPFMAWTIQPPELAPPGAIEFRINRVSASMPDLPDELKLDDSAVLATVPMSLQRAWHAVHNDPTEWPTFPLERAPAKELQAAIAVTQGIHPVTSVSTITVAQGDDNALADYNSGPVRRYPGVPLFPLEWPDFNGDGYNDLMLWRFRDLQPSLNRVTEAVLSGEWSLRVTTHRYLPEKARFEARATAQLDVAIPTVWLLDAYQGVPLRHLIVEDLDGDGRSDLAFSNGVGRFSVWLCNSNGELPRSNSFTRTFEEEIEAVTFVQDLNGDGLASIGLKAVSRLYILNPTRESASDQLLQNEDNPAPE